MSFIVCVAFENSVDFHFCAICDPSLTQWKIASTTFCFVCWCPRCYKTLLWFLFVLVLLKNEQSSIFCWWRPCLPIICYLLSRTLNLYFTQLGYKRYPRCNMWKVISHLRLSTVLWLFTVGTITVAISSSTRNLQFSKTSSLDLHSS